jgi:sec-independent protein translocase protein TatA
MSLHPSHDLASRFRRKFNRRDHIMLGLGNPIHLIFLLVLLLLVFGAKRLPEMGRSLGSGMRGFRDSLSGESGQYATHEQAPPVAVEQASVVATAASAPGETRAS